MKLQDDNEIQAREAKERALLRRAGHFSDFGTLTSLGASALYMVERVREGDKIPPAVNAISLVAITVGMGSVITSFFIRNRAGKVAHENEKRLIEDVREARTQTVANNKDDLPTKWTDKQAAKAEASTQPVLG